MEVFHDISPADEIALLEPAFEWQSAKYAAGWGAVSVPEQYGGRGLPRTYERAFSETEAEFEVPETTETFRVTQGLVVPTLIRHATPELCGEVLPELLGGRAMVCQLFSEPEAGSDLAALRCTARPDGDGWRIDGQKVWTSGALVSRYGLLIARTDPSVPKHRGMTAFLVDMDDPGTTIRPIRQMSGGASFNEVFFDNSYVSDARRIGAPGEGWSVALTTLEFEREVSGDHHAEVGGSVDQLMRLAQVLRATTDALTRQGLIDVHVRSTVLEWTNTRVSQAARSGANPGAIGSIAKLMWTDNMRRIGEVACRLLGPSIIADDGRWGTYCWSQHVLGAPGYRIAGGSDEIQRNIIGERVLGLPREPLAR